MATLTPIGYEPEPWTGEDDDTLTLPKVEVPAVKGDKYKRSLTLPKVELPSADSLQLPEIIDPNAAKPATPPAKLTPVGYEPEPWTGPKAKPGVVSNIVRGGAERAVQLIGETAGVIGDIGETAGDWLDQTLGKPVREADGTITWRRLTPEEAKGSSSWITQKLREVRTGMKDPDFGYDPGTTWEDVKSAPLANIVPFALETGLVSAADMVLAVKNAPGYVLEQTGEISQTRAANEGRAEPTFGDIMKSLPAATISAWMEKIGTSKMLGLDDVALTELKQLPADLLKTLAVEGATEAAQQAAQIGGEEAFTQKGIDWWEAAEKTLQAGLVGAIFGPAVKAPIGGYQIATAPKTEEEVIPAADTTQANPASPPIVPAGDGTAAVGTPTPGGQPGDPPQPASVPDTPVPDNGVIVNQPGDVDPTIAAGATGAPVEEKITSGAIPEDDEVDDVDDLVAETKTSTELAAGNQAIRDMFAEENAAKAKDAAEELAANVEIIKNNVIPEQAAAIAAAAGVEPHVGETLGTGKALDAMAPPENAPQAAPLDTPKTAEAVAPAVTEELATPAPLEPAPPAVNIGADPNAVVPPERPIVTAPPEPVVQADRVVPAEPQSPAPAVQGETSAATVAEAASQLPPPAEKKKRYRKPKAEAAQVLEAPAAKEGEAVAFPATVEAASPTAPRETPAEPKKLTLKGDRFKKPVGPPPPELIRKPAESVAAKPAPPAQPTPASEPAAAPDVERAKKLSRDVADRARQVGIEARSTVSDLQEFHPTVQRVAAAHVAEHPRRADESPREYIERLAKDVHEAVDKELGETKEAADEARIAETEKATSHYKDVAKVEKAEAAEKKQREGTAQQHERYDQSGQKSAAGIRQEGWEATRDRAIKEEAKPEAERDPDLMEWLALHREEKTRKTSKERKEEIAARKAEVQERRAQKSTRKAPVEKAAQEDTETKRAEAVRETIQNDVVAKLPPIAKEAEIRQHAKESNKGLAFVMRALYQADRTQFVNAVREALKAKGLQLSGKRDWTRQSPEENMAIWGRDKEAAGRQVTEWGMARTLLETGDDVALKGLIGSEILTGSGSSEDAGKYGPVERGAIGDSHAWTETEEVTAGDTVKSLSNFTTMEVDDEGNVYQAHKVASPGRTGRRTVLTREIGKALRAEGTVDDHTIRVTLPDGTKKDVKTTVMSAEHALRENLREIEQSDAMFDRLTGSRQSSSSFAFLRNVLTKRLIDMVGDVQVHFVDKAGMLAIDGEEGTVGFYTNLQDSRRAKGERPIVVIRSDLNDAERSHTLIHELVHAATSQALREGVRGTDKILRRMMTSMKAQMKAEGLTDADMKDMGLEYGFTNEAEFLAEALSNREFQAWLKQTAVPEDIAASVSAMGEGRVPRWWDAVIDAVNNAVGYFMGRKGASYMDNVLTVYSQLERSSLQQRMAAKSNVGPFGIKTWGKKERLGAEERQARMLNDVFEQAKQAVADKADNLARTRGKTAGYKLISSHEAIRQWERLWGGAGNPIERLLNGHIRSGPRLKELRKTPGAGVDSAAVEEAVVRFEKRHPVEATRLAELMNAGTGYQANITAPLSDPTNAHLQGKGNRRRQARAQHANLHAQFLALTPAAQKLGRDQVEHYRKAGEIESRQFMHYALGQAIREYRLGPKLAQIGKSEADAVDWFMRDRAMVDPANQTQEDKDFHSVLGNTATTLAKVPSLKRIKGMYVPLRREGKYFINGTDKPFANGAPAGAVIDPNADNVALFKDEKKMQAYVDTLDRQASVTTRYYDANGNRTTLAQTPNANKAYAVTVQNALMEMSDNPRELRRRAEELRAQGFDIADVRDREADMYKVAEEISPAGIKAIIRNLEQTTVGSSTVTQQAAKKAVLDAHIRSLTTPGHLQSRLKRRNVLGADVNMFKALRGYNRGLATTLLNYEMGPEMAEAEAAAKDFIRQRAKNNYGTGTEVLTMQNQLQEALTRIKETNRDGSGPRMEAVKNVTFLRHLASPHYTIYNLLQPLAMTLPILSARMNKGRAWRLMIQAYNIGAGMPSAGRAFRETGKRLITPWRQHADVDYQDYWDAAIAREPDGKELADVITAMKAHGVGASSGLEADVVGEAGMNRAQVFVNRMVGIAKQFPEMAEAINRNTTAIASYRGFRELGLSHAEAVRESVHMVEQTQGGYDAANHAAWMANPYLAPATQFKKYSVTYGQMYYRNLAWAIRHQDAAQQKQSRKAVVALSLTGVALAGVFGNPLMEIAKVLINTAAALGWKDDDWEDTKSGIQDAFADAVEWATSSEAVGDKVSEMLFRGVSRAVDLDTANNLSNDSLFLFGQPKDWDKESVYAYITKTIFGAPGEMVANSVGSALDGDILGAIPWPKAIDNVRKGIGLMTEGTVNKQTGEQYAKPVGIVEGAYQALGLKPASQSRQWEGGTGAEAKRRRKVQAGRRDIMARWSYASPSERHQIFREEVRAWNREHKGDEKITMDNLVRSKESRKKRRKELEKAAEED